MLRSLSTAVGGLRNHQTKLDVVGNNIANVNTVGYKYEDVRFQDLFSQTLRGATAPLEGRGGVNPMQVGLGMEVSSITTIHTPGAITSTGRETDLAIEGRGFFVVSDGFQNYYTRDGSFARDSTGTLVNANGLRLMGWEGDEEDFDPANIGEINIPLGEEMVARPTDMISFAGNLDSGKEEGEDFAFSYDAYIYDSLGNRHHLRFTFEKEADNQWGVTAQLVTVDDEGDEVLDDISFTDDSESTLYFTPSGQLELMDNGDLREYMIELDGDGLETGADDMEITLDFSKITQLASSSNVFVREQNGFPAGELAAFDIEETGRVTGIYTNGMVKDLAWLAMASFANPEGLTKLGSNLYDITSNSGDARIGLPGDDGRGMVKSRALEMSNVDLAKEFTEMIISQRGFQANTRMISTSDEVLMELINVKR